MSADKSNISEEQVLCAAVEAIRLRAMQAHHRAILVLSGEQNWCDESASLIASTIPASMVEWVGKDQESQQTQKQHFTAKLGREVDLLVFPLVSDFDANRLTALSGMIRGGGLLVFQLTRTLWNSESHFDQRFIHALHQPGIDWLRQGKKFKDVIPGIEQKTRKLVHYNSSLDSSAVVPDAALPPASMQSRLRGNDVNVGMDTGEKDELYLNEQNDLVKSLQQLCQAQEKSTIVIQSDRGRGKSAALGLAAAKWLQSGEDVYLTGPGLKSVEQVFWHAQQQLPEAESSRGCLRYQDKQLQFLPPDAINADQKHINRLLVDEAAAIPIPKLGLWLQHIPQLIFSTTIHGYEGTGKGFLLKFGKQLDQHRPGWQKLTMQQPIRWANDDFLEQWLNKTFLLDADIQAVDSSFLENKTSSVSSENGVAQEQSAAGMDKILAAEYLDSGFEVAIKNSTSSNHQIRIEHNTNYDLYNDEHLLQKIYGLLINAHYRTTPKDLRYLLDTHHANIYCLNAGHNLLAAAWVMHEGEFDQDLADAVYLGQRRPTGHLLAQSLAYHCAIRDAATYRYARIVRIAVHPQCQRHGLGSQLLQHIIATETEVDAIGASFSATPEGMDFWQKNGFTPVRIGMSRHQASGEHSVMLLHPMNEAGQSIMEQGRKRMLDALPYHLQEPLADLDSELVMRLADTELSIDKTLTDADWQELVLFAHAHRTYAETLAPLVKLVNVVKLDDGLLSDMQQKFITEKVLQHKSWDQVIASTGLEGQKQAVQLLRDAVSLLLKQNETEELEKHVQWVKAKQAGSVVG